MKGNENTYKTKLMPENMNLTGKCWNVERTECVTCIYGEREEGYLLELEIYILPLSMINFLL